MKLADLPEPHAARVKGAEDAAAWIGRCVEARGEAWLAWNVREDGWYGAAELAAVAAAIASAPAGLAGPALLLHVLPSLPRLRQLTSAEQAHLPDEGVNHLAARFYSSRYRLAPESASCEGSLRGELSVNLGDRLRVKPKPMFTVFAWLTFAVGGVAVPMDPDEVVRKLGLDWNKSGGAVVRVRVPMRALRERGAIAVIPTIFDALTQRPARGTTSVLQDPNWRARPVHEHHSEEFWGHARDMLVDGPGLPEVIMEITHAGTMDAECIGLPEEDWSRRPFLSRSAPR